MSYDVVCSCVPVCPYAEPPRPGLAEAECVFSYQRATALLLFYLPIPSALASVSDPLAPQYSSLQRWTLRMVVRAMAFGGPFCGHSMSFLGMCVQVFLTRALGEASRCSEQVSSALFRKPLLKCYLDQMQVMTCQEWEWGAACDPVVEHWDCSYSFFQ